MVPEFSSVAVSPRVPGSRYPLPLATGSLPNCPQLLVLQGGFLQVAVVVPSEWDCGTAAGQKDRQDGGAVGNGGIPEPWDLTCLPHSLRLKKCQDN